MGTVVALRPRAREEFTSSLGMLIFLASWAMMFAALFFSYGYARSKSITWPPPGLPALPLGLPALSTAVILASSVTLARGLKGVQEGRRSSLAPMIALTFGLGLAFVGLQVVLFQQVALTGLHRSNGIYGGVFYGFTAFHALHVIVGLVLLLWVLVGALRGSYSEHKHTTVRLCTMYWHFVDVVWVLMFLTIFVL